MIGQIAVPTLPLYDLALIQLSCRLARNFGSRIMFQWIIAGRFVRMSKPLNKLRVANLWFSRPMFFLLQVAVRNVLSLRRSWVQVQSVKHYLDVFVLYKACSSWHWPLGHVGLPYVFSVFRLMSHTVHILSVLYSFETDNDLKWDSPSVLIVPVMLLKGRTSINAGLQKLIQRSLKFPLA